MPSPERSVPNGPPSWNWKTKYWDTYMRNEAHELKSRRYIENNPTKAFLVRDPKTWPWTSARFRDDYGVLHL